ncbi:hypothetical protein AAEI00_02660 [Shewanella algae]|uniref:hypothetical protein n=1 Tax=Shewanella algae TaxID=38313 RepID=UPI0031860733
MIKKGGLYSASDKAFFDALCQHKMSKPALQELLWRRGILKSSKAEKEEIARYFSRLDHDYFDHKSISEKVSTGSNREKQTAHFSSVPVALETIETVAKELVNTRKEIDNSISFVTTEKSVQVKVSYSYYDHNKPEFKQLVTKDALISIETSEEGLSLRAPDNEYVSEITSKILSDIEDKHENELDIETISLHGIDDVEKKISFFESLITGIDNMQLYDVSDVAVFNPDTGDEDDLGVYVKRASLNGEGVLKSGELKQFYKKGFLFIAFHGLQLKKIIPSQISTIFMLNLMILNTAESSLILRRE